MQIPETEPGDKKGSAMMHRRVRPQSISSWLAAKRLIRIGVAVMLGWLALWGIEDARYAHSQSRNWLSNPGFEDEGRWPFQAGAPEVQVPPGWFAFWRPDPPDDLLLPSNCPRRSDVGCYWARPEFRDVKASDFAQRVRSGTRAVRYFGYGRMYEAGLYQVVEEIPVGERLRFSVWLQTWMCADASACRGGQVSDAPSHMHLRVGLDPWGGLDPWSPDVIWSPEGEAFDHWRLFQVEALSEMGSATVFIRSRAEWDWPRMNNDVYVDDASLEILPAPTLSAPRAVLSGLARAQTPALQTPALQATATWDGQWVTHTVAVGETLGSIALQYGVSVEQLVRLNRLVPGQTIKPRQVLTIFGPEVTSTPLAVATRPSATPAAKDTPGTLHTAGWPWVWIGGGLIGAIALVAGVSIVVSRRARPKCADM